VVVVKSFKDLDVYKKAFDVSLKIHKETLGFPSVEQFALSSQIRRASKGICANIAEGFSKQSQSKAEFKRYLSIAMGSSNEMLVWIDYCYELEYISQEQYAFFYESYTHIAKMLNKLMGSL